MEGISKQSIKKFQEKVLDFYKQHGRTDLPWRKVQTPYRVFLSEIMLQQTQAGRVISKFNEFFKVAPTIKKLAGLSQTQILKLWQGLGYNNRALRLHLAAKEIVKTYKGNIPQEKETLIALPGIGPYTAGAIRVFAWNVPDIFIETNIRRVFIYEFFRKKKEIHDQEILDLIEQTLYIKNPRMWYEALMDYGASLPKILKQNPNTQSRHYTKQSKFQGSNRQLRGKILQLTLAGKKISPKALGEEKVRLQNIMTKLRKDGFNV